MDAKEPSLNLDPKNPMKEEIEVERMAAAPANVCLAVFMDVAGTSAAFVMTAPLAHDHPLFSRDTSWIVNAYALPLIALFFFAGRRIVVLCSSNLVFAAGFLGCGILNLIISFTTNSAIFTVFTPPSSVNMFMQVYRDRKQ
ncbi:hypothetical protein CspeluHIS016_0201130 [Cutaneotrichosporon spelunceum]|uniref:Uncharacterized protein n=1 Tax=Cutaneotrichosporon spelunceum TaxID=1672016 RepID=A0AAD3YAN8_9TREE|nr:hypothetical protein CspeluHIS016_0201130 [Cutaneotrichosporon spelunceum]